MNEKKTVSLQNNNDIIQINNTMKNRILLIAATLIASVSAWASPVDAGRARAVAEGTMSRIEVPTGVYMVRVAGGTAHKVVVTR